MGTYAGCWQFDDPRRDVDFIDSVYRLVSTDSPDSTGCYQQNGLCVVNRAFCADAEARNEVQPYRSPSGLIVTWDGRLDNRAQLLSELDGSFAGSSPDVSILAAAYEKWGEAVFARIIGDWTLTICNPQERLVVLAKDAIGPRHLYWHISPHHLVWSTSLEIIASADRCPHSLDQDYVAGWFCDLPSPDLTPFSSIHSVAPGSIVRIRPGKCTITTFDVFDPTERIHYRQDCEYEEHFRAAFAESVRRRLRSDRPVLAELSGGMDSSSIVCMADHLMRREHADAPRLDTVSFYDPSEPNWDERPYFSIVEKWRGRAGRHIDVSRSNSSVPLSSERFGIVPSECGVELSEAAQFADCLSSHESRIVLSGIGGDEVTGGVPSPIPELADYLARLRFRILARQMTAWALSTREPLIYLLAATCKSFLPKTQPAIRSLPAAEWLTPEFIRKHKKITRVQTERLRLFASRPSYQENLLALKALQSQLEHSGRRTTLPHEVRYPYLDKDFLEFLFAIPREQIVRPGQRRSLMRRALAGIVPREILERKRKAYILRAPMLAIATNWEKLNLITHEMVSSEMGIVDPDKFRQVLSQIRGGTAVPIAPVLRTLLVEQWLRGHLRASSEEQERSDPKRTTSVCLSSREPVATQPAQISAS